VNPAIAFLTGSQRAGTTPPLTVYRRSALYDATKHNKLIVTETSFTLIGHVGRDTRRTVIAPDGSRQAGQLKLQADDTQVVLVTMKEAAAGESGKLPDVIVWMGDRYVASDVDDLTGHQVAMLRTRTYSLVRENPA